MAVDLRAIENLLTARIGLDPKSVGPQMISRAVRHRMRELKLEDTAGYIAQVSQNGTELAELIDEVVVAESWFFRDARPFEWLRITLEPTGSRLQLAQPCGS
jgi:chemotaxis protein methyltransferase WspC